MTNQSGITGVDPESRWTPGDGQPVGDAERADADELREPLTIAEFLDRQVKVVGAGSATFVVGPGVKAALDAAGDLARSDEQYNFDSNGAVLYSITQGRDAIYRWTPADGTKRLPFG